MAGTHASKSPSGAERWHACPGAIPYIDSLPEEERLGAGQAAAMGTAAHFLLEKSLQEDKHPTEYLGRIIVLLEDDSGCSMLKPTAKQPGRSSLKVWFEVDDQMADGVAMAWEYVHRRCDELHFPIKDILTESRTNPCPERDDTFGTADVTIDIWPELLEVVDYKNGYLLVEHEGNPQLLSYLAGKAHDTGWSHDHYQITVIQPNAKHDDGRVRTMVVPREELQAFVRKHRAAAERVDDATITFTGDVNAPVPFKAGTWADSYLVAGPHCSMCSAGLRCPVRKAHAANKAKVDWAAEPLEGEAAADAVADRVPTSLDGAVEVLKWAPFVLALIRQAQSYATAAMRAGQTHPGIKMVRSRGTGVWKPDLKPESIPAAMVKDGLISDNERARLFTEPQLISGPQAEKLITGKGSGARKKMFRETYMTTKPGSVKVVLSTEPGEPVPVASAADSFADDPLEEGDY